MESDKFKKKNDKNHCYEETFVGTSNSNLKLEDVQEDSFLSLPSSSSSSPDTDTPNSKCEAFEPSSTNELKVSDIESLSKATALVPLEPFVHQVGGHFPMVCLATETICKPLNDREHNFYRTLPGILHPYTPKFEGVMSVALHEDENGYISLMGTPPHYLEKSLNKHKIRGLKPHQQMLLLHHHIQQQQQIQENLFGKKSAHQIRMRRTDSLEIERTDTPTTGRFSFSVPPSIPASSTGSPKERPRTSSEHSNLASLLTETETYCSPKYYFCPTPEEIEAEETNRLSEEIESKEEIFCNPWALKCHRDHLKKLGLLSSPQSSHSGGSNSSMFGNNATQLYLLLENIVSKYAKPCVLDLKVGSRQYADDVSAAKKQRKIAKSANTTSASLGLRLCGMQVFNASTGKFLCHNKYYGRGLTTEGFSTAIEKFLNNSDKPELIRVDIINQLIEKLQNLVSVLKQLESFRFYTSSLLVTYDGSTKSADCESLQLVDVRIIDFAHSTHKGLKDSTLHFGPDEGFIYGIENFITILEEIKFPRG